MCIVPSVATKHSRESRRGARLNGASPGPPIRLPASGVAVGLVQQTGMAHGFFRMAGVIERAVVAYEQSAAALRRACA
jgi:hypothetical protein